MSTKELELDPVYSEALTPERFLDALQKREEDIESVRISPAKLGRRGFGHIVVRWKTPVYKHRAGYVKQEHE